MQTLEPRFFAVPASLHPLPDGAIFSIRWFSKCDDYTLINYRCEIYNSRYESEILYKGHDAIWDDPYGGEAPLHREVPTEMIVQSPDPRARIPQNLGSLDVPSQVAIELRSLSRRVNFQA